MKQSAAMLYGDKHTPLVCCAPRNESVSIHDLKSLTLFRNMNFDLATGKIVLNSSNVFRTFRILSLERLDIDFAYLMKLFD